MHARLLKVTLLMVGGMWLSLATTGAMSTNNGYYQDVDGVAIYFGIVPAEMVRGHPRGHPESQMHSGAQVGENHVMIALYNSASGKRITDAEVTAKVSGVDGRKLEKRLKSMLIAGRKSYGNYFYMPGAGPYRFELSIRLPGGSRIIRAIFTWARS
jgi:hypothetical protein